MPDLKIAHPFVYSAADGMQYELGLGVYTNMSQEFCDDWFVQAHTEAGSDKPRARALIDEWYAKAMTLVLKHTTAIERVAAALLARTTLTESEVKEALA